MCSNTNSLTLVHTLLQSLHVTPLLQNFSWVINIQIPITCLAVSHTIPFYAAPAQPPFQALAAVVSLSET